MKLAAEGRYIFKKRSTLSMNSRQLRTRILHYVIEIIFFCCTLFSLIILIKPGAAVFYKRIPIQSNTFEEQKVVYSKRFQLDTTIFPPDSFLFSENGNFFERSTVMYVRSGKPSTFTSSITSDGHILLNFSPSNEGKDHVEAQSYQIWIKPSIINRTTGAIAVIIFLAGMFIISVLDPQTFKPVRWNPIQIVWFWLNGNAGKVISIHIHRFTSWINSLIQPAVERLKQPAFLFHQVLIPCGVIGIFSGILALLSSNFLLKGVTYHFLIQLFIGLTGLSVLILLLLLLQKYFNRADLAASPRFARQFHPEELLFLLFPFTPVVQYIVNNLNVFSFTNSLIVIAFISALAGLLIFVLPYVFGRITSQKTLLALGLALSYLVTNMASITRQYTWYEYGSFILLALLFLVIFLVVKLVPTRILTIFFVLNFVSSGLFQYINQIDSRAKSTPHSEENALTSLLQDNPASRMPNVYLLVYDSYGPYETMLEYDFDNSNQITYLKENGFTLYPATYSLGSSTLFSMDSTLNLSPEFSSDIRKSVSGDGIVHQAFHELGYTTWGLFSTDYMFLSTTSKYDYSIPKSSLDNHLLEAILTGEFRYDLGFQQQDHQEFIAEKTEQLKYLPSTPLFVYSHTNLPGHSPTTGVCREGQREIYLKRIENANLEMKQDITNILENDPDAIVIIAGDHGTYLTKNCYHLNGVYDQSEVSRLDIQDRYGTLLAIHWPTEDYVQYDQITVLQDVFPAVFAYLTQDEAFLSTRIRPARTMTDVVSGAYVEDGIIHGGINDGEPLFLSTNE